MILKKTLISLTSILFLFLCTLLINTNAKLMITTQIATGTISLIQENAIQLEEDYNTYYPIKKAEILNVQPGDLVTLEFYIDPEGKRYYVAVALGKNTLKASPPPKPTQKKSFY